MKEYKTFAVSKEFHRKVMLEKTKKGRDNVEQLLQEWLDHYKKTNK